mmetsp:Transcript_1891/g.6219  ORF Transcript_1891/g.6219 Transcript_1891/m.6219 type:complete len:311 (+) Transcript_1891:1000-1932(+)
MEAGSSVYWRRRAMSRVIVCASLCGVCSSRENHERARCVGLVVWPGPLHPAGPLWPLGRSRACECAPPWPCRSDSFVDVRLKHISGAQKGLRKRCAQTDIIAGRRRRLLMQCWMLHVVECVTCGAPPRRPIESGERGELRPVSEPLTTRRAGRLPPTTAAARRGSPTAATRPALARGRSARAQPCRAAKRAPRGSPAPPPRPSRPAARATPPAAPCARSSKGHCSSSPRPRPPPATRSGRPGNLPASSDLRSSSSRRSANGGRRREARASPWREAAARPPAPQPSPRKRTCCACRTGRTPSRASRRRAPT